MSDPRIKLFGIECNGLDDVVPLYTQDTIVYFDRYSDSDPYEDETYIQNFQTVLRAMREKRRLNIKFTSHRGIEHEKQLTPYRFEYSPQDDKFRLLSMSSRRPWVINMACVSECSVGRKARDANEPLPKRNREMLIRVIAFGPVLKVTEPESFIELIKERLMLQKNLNM